MDLPIHDHAILLAFLATLFIFCFGLPPYFIGEYHSLIFLLAENGILSPD